MKPVWTFVFFIVMNSKDNEASLGKLRALLLSSLDFAEDFGHNEPKYAAAVFRFSQEIRRIKREFMSSFENGSPTRGLPDILVGLGARAIASFMADRHPEKSEPLTLFMDGLEHAREELRGKVLPGPRIQA